MPAPREDFASTQWSLVLRAGGKPGSSARAALEVLCSRYWLPLYVFVRRRVNDAHAAQDLTQEFFTRLLAKNTLAHAEPERGRFRGFLLAALKHFLANESDRARARKRGGGRQLLSLDWEQGESRYHLEPRDERTAERIFDRQWALTLLDRVVRRLQDEYLAAGKTRQFDLLKDALTGRAAVAYAAVAEELSLSQDAVRQAASRLRKRYRTLLREEVAATVAGQHEVDDEIRALFAALAP
jgi:RNA polymerase sigma-70 factor (ECF subfamily)